MHILVRYETVHARYYNMDIFDVLQVPPRDVPNFRPILVLLSTRSKANPQSHAAVANRKPTHLVDFLPKVAPPRPQIHA